MKKFCLFCCCCGCLLVFLVLVAIGVGGYTIVKKGMEAPPNYTRSTTPLDEAQGKDLIAKIYSGGQDGRLELTLSKADLRNMVGAAIQQAFKDARGPMPLKLEDVQIDFKPAKELPSVMLPGAAYPVPLDKSVRIDLITALNFATNSQDPFVVYPTMKLLAGVNDCGLYWTIVDVGIGPYAMIDAFKLMESTGGRGRRNKMGERVPLPAASCASELSQSGDSLRIVIGPEAGAPASP